MSSVGGSVPQDGFVGRVVRVLVRDARDLADRFGIKKEVARKLWRDADERGQVVRVGRIKRGQLGAPAFVSEIAIPAAAVVVGILRSA